LNVAAPALLLCAAAALLVACGVPGSTPRPTSGESPDPTASIPAASTTPLPSVGEVIVHVEVLTQICDTWGDSAPPELIACSEGIGLALGGIGPAASTVTKVTFRYGQPCGPTEACPDRAPNRAWVYAISNVAGPLIVSLARGDDGGLLVWPPEPGPPPPPPPSFDPPPVGRPDVGGAAPAEVRNREPLPLCGEEQAEPDVYDTDARRCFLDGVLADVRVELVSREFGVEGQAVLTIYRFAGSGGIVRYAEAGNWSRYVCGITPLPTIAVFGIDGLCEREEPTPDLD
jgi:hypothetical protein